MKALVPMIAIVIGPLFVSVSYSDIAVIGWQTFQNFGGNNNTGISDSTPDTNSTYDSTPVGSNVNNWYLTGTIGPGASATGRRGLGQATNNTFLNGSTFGSDLNIVDYTLADGSAGERIGPFGGSGCSSWKFGNNNNAFLQGDFQVTNVSDYYFKLEKVHFDARGLAAAASPNELTLKYLATPSNLINVNTGTEVQDGKTFYNNVWSEKGVENVSQGIAAVINSSARLAPGDSASFRFLWSGQTGGGQAQIDNLAFSGTFLDQNDGFKPINPWDLTAVPEPTSIAIWGLVGLCGFSQRKRRAS
ncbi:MAG: hypothetical protein MK106_01850 [Mariniblastus sp.]|nr:hypothetical protein [Mariniblastus sp.]